jgi:hypothetical protein
MGWCVIVDLKCSEYLDLVFFLKGLMYMYKLNQCTN